MENIDSPHEVPRGHETGREVRPIMKTVAQTHLAVVYYTYRNYKDQDIDGFEREGRLVQTCSLISRLAAVSEI